MTDSRSRNRLVLLTVGALVSFSAAGQPHWTWTDFEVVGQRDLTREQILEGVPVELGSPYEPDQAIGDWCRQLKQRFDLHQVSCSPLRFADGKSYLVVNVVEKGDEHRVRFRPEPDGEVELATPEAREVFEKLESRQWAFFDQGKPPRESTENGYLDYDDAEMHGYAARLREVLGPHRDNLLEVIARDKDEEKRGAAARMLNWAGDVTGSIERVHPYLDDPSSLVRNNVARFMLHYVAEVGSPEVRHAVVDRLAAMLDQPTHADRNKAVYGLLNMARARPEDREHMLEAAGENLERLARQSILMNVRDPAEELLELLGETRGGGTGVTADPLVQKLVDQARNDLAKKLSISEDAVEVVRAERVTWRDSSLGCPEPETFYMQMLTPGVLIELKAGGKLYPYHSSLQGPPAYCEKPSPAGPLPAEDE